MKKSSLAFFFLFWAVSAVALTVLVSPDQVQKQDVLRVEGECSQTVLVQVEWQQKTVLEITGECNNNRFGLSIPVSFLVPTGELTLFVSENTQTVHQTVLILPSRESAFLSISLISPVERSMMRGQTDTIRVTVLDGSTPVSDAKIRAWDFENQSLEFESKGTGVFEAVIRVPLDAPVGAWNLTVLASTADETTAGGEQSFEIPISKASIGIELPENAPTQFSANQPVRIRFQVKYATGSLVLNPAISAQLDNQPIPVIQQGDWFELTVPGNRVKNGLNKVSVVATDSAQNSGDKTIEFFVVRDFSSEVSEWLPIIGLSLVLVLLVATQIIPRVRSKKAWKAMKKRRQQIETELALLQKEYFEANTVSKEAFDQKTNALLAEAAELDKKINTKTD